MVAGRVLNMWTTLNLSGLGKDDNNHKHCTQPLNSISWSTMLYAAEKMHHQPHHEINSCQIKWEGRRIKQYLKRWWSGKERNYVNESLVSPLQSCLHLENPHPLLDHKSRNMSTDAAPIFFASVQMRMRRERDVRVVLRALKSASSGSKGLSWAGLKKSASMHYQWNPVPSWISPVHPEDRLLTSALAWHLLDQFDLPCDKLRMLNRDPLSGQISRHPVDHGWLAD